MKGQPCLYVRGNEIHFCQADERYPDCHECEIYKKWAKEGKKPT